MITLQEAVAQRHSIRSYTSQAIPPEVAAELNELIKRCNSEGGLNLQLILNEPKAFGSKLNHYGMFNNVRNYLVLAGRKSKDLDYRLGYYGAKVMLLAQQLGLNSCWVGLTYKKVTEAYTLRPDDKMESVIALGYGDGTPVNHRYRSLEQVADIDDNTPQWFIDGVKTALLAPTAVNQQKFHFRLIDGVVHQSTGIGFFTEMDLGIVRYFFEIGAARDVQWSRVLSPTTK